MIRNNNITGIIQCLPDNLPPRSRTDKGVNFPADFFRKCLIGRDQDTGSIRVMFCLSKDISRDNPRMGSGVGDDADLAWACREINLHLLPQHHLGKGHVYVPGSNDLLHRFYGFCTKGHGSDGLGTAGAVDLGDPGDIQCHKGHGTNGRGGTGTDLADAGYLCRYRTHEGRGRVGSTPAGDIEPDTVESGCFHTQHNTGFHLLKPEVFWFLEFVKAFDPCMRLDQTLDNFCFNLIVGSLTLFIADRDLGENDVTGEFPQCGIAILLHPVNDIGHRAPGIFKA
jgi:hypothetical protein